MTKNESKRPHWVKIGDRPATGFLDNPKTTRVETFKDINSGKTVSTKTTKR